MQLRVLGSYETGIGVYEPNTRYFVIMLNHRFMPSEEMMNRMANSGTRVVFLGAGEHLEDPSGFDEGGVPGFAIEVRVSGTGQAARDNLDAYLNRLGPVTLEPQVSLASAMIWAYEESRLSR